jgi:hypothetical protein
VEQTFKSGSALAYQALHVIDKYRVIVHYQTMAKLDELKGQAAFAAARWAADEYTKALHSHEGAVDFQIGTETVQGKVWGLARSW